MTQPLHEGDAIAGSDDKVPSFYSFNADEPVFLIRYVDRVASRVLLNMARAVRADPGFAPTTDYVVDMRDLVDIDFRSSDFLGHMMRLAAEKQPLAERVRYALLINPDNAGTIAVLNTYLGYADLAPGVEFRQFEAAEEARRWLGLRGSVEALLAAADWIEVDDGLDAAGDGRAG